MGRIPSLNLSKFKKIASDEMSTTLKNESGHEIKLAHRQLSPENRQALQALPIHKMADGGDVKSQQQKMPDASQDPMYIDPKKAEAFVKGATESGWQPKRWAKNIKEGLNLAQGGDVDDEVEQRPNKNRTATETLGSAIGYPGFPKPTKKDKGFADGGDTTPAEPNKKNAQAMQKGATQSGWQPEQWAKNLKEGLTMADGGEAVSGDDSPPPTAPPVSPSQEVEQEKKSSEPATNSATQPSPVAGVAPTVNINVGAPQQAPQMAALPPVPAPFQTPQVSDPNGALPYGVTPEKLQEASQAPTNEIQNENPPPTAQMLNDAAPNPQDPFGVNAMQQFYGTGINEQQAGIALQGKGEADLAKAQQIVQHQSVQQQQAIANTYQENSQKLMDEHQALIDDYKKGHVDPFHYLSNMDTGKKITTAIGLILGGIGGGITHQGNPAMSFLQNQIDRDIESQKANLGKQENLLSMNMKMFGNLRDATDFTRASLLGITAEKLKEQAAKAGSPLAAARALQAAGQLDAGASGQMSQIATRQTLLGGVNAGKVDPAQFIRAVIPEKEQAPMYKELGEAKNMFKQRDNVLSAFDKVAQLNTLPNHLMNPLQTPRQIEALKGPIVAALSKETAGRFTEQDSKMLDTLFSKMGNDADTNKILRNQIVKMFEERSYFPHLAAYPQIFGALGGQRFNQGGKSNFTEGAPVAVK